MMQLPSEPATLIGAALCFGLRVLEMMRRWRLPVASEDNGKL
jgi:hypothetical protein